MLILHIGPKGRPLPTPVVGTQKKQLHLNFLQLQSHSCSYMRSPSSDRSLKFLITWGFLDRISSNRRTTFHALPAMSFTLHFWGRFFHPFWTILGHELNVYKGLLAAEG
jgi:hypothetical protein